MVQATALITLNPIFKWWLIVSLQAHGTRRVVTVGGSILPRTVVLLEAAAFCWILALLRLRFLLSLTFLFDPSASLAFPFLARFLVSSVF
jgi:hypothetical protein